MKQLVLGSLAASLAVYLWSAIWFPSLAGYKATGWVYDEDEVARLLQTQFTKPGSYVIPGSNGDAETLKERREKGPAVTVQFLTKDNIPSTRWRGFRGFLQTLAATFLIGWMMRYLNPALHFWPKVGIVVLAGLAAAVYNDLAASVWWYHPWRWSLVTAIYDLTAWLIAGFILAFFIKRAQIKESSMTAALVKSRLDRPESPGSEPPDSIKSVTLETRFATIRTPSAT